MVTNLYFNNVGASSEQFLIEDLIIESIKIYGQDVVYLPREIINRDFVFNEDSVSKYQDNYLIEMYVRNVDGFEGEGDFLSKFGVEVRDQITFTVAQRRFEEDIGAYESTVRPNEGDIIYFPLNGNYYEVKFVEHEAIFYQLGELQTYDLRCELFEYSGEEFNTGDTDLDFIEDDNLINTLFYAIQTQDGENLGIETGGVIINESFNVNTLTQSNNNIYQTESESISLIDFSERDPFSEGNY